MIKPSHSNHPHEYPIVRYWYTKHKGQTIEEIIRKDPEYFEWCVNTFQDVTPGQARYYKEITGKEVPHEYIQDVPPYEWIPGDPDKLYMELCTTKNLEEMILKYRGLQMDLF